MPPLILGWGLWCRPKQAFRRGYPQQASLRKYQQHHTPAHSEEPASAYLPNWEPVFSQRLLQGRSSLWHAINVGALEVAPSTGQVPSHPRVVGPATLRPDAVATVSLQNIQAGLAVH